MSSDEYIKMGAGHLQRKDPITGEWVNVGPVTEFSFKPEPSPEPHPPGAYLDGEKLAIIGCPCRFCFDRMLDGPGRRRMTR